MREKIKYTVLFLEMIKQVIFGVKRGQIYLCSLLIISFIVVSHITKQRANQRNTVLIVVFHLKVTMGYSSIDITGF
jgi:putative copper export protein